MKNVIHHAQTTAVFASVGSNEDAQLRSFPDALTLLSWAMRPHYDNDNTKDRSKRKVVVELRVDVNGEPKEIISQEWMINVAIKPNISNSQFAIKVASEAFGCDTLEEATNYMVEDETTEMFGVFEAVITLTVTING